MDTPFRCENIRRYLLSILRTGSEVQILPGAFFIFFKRLEKLICVCRTWLKSIFPVSSLTRRYHHFDPFDPSTGRIQFRTSVLQIILPVSSLTRRYHTFEPSIENGRPCVSPRTQTIGISCHPDKSELLADKSELLAYESELLPVKSESESFAG